MRVVKQPLHEALDWLIELREAGPDDPLHQRWRHWCEAHPDNQQAWAKVCGLQQRLQAPQGQLLLKAWRQGERQTLSRRKALGALAILLGSTASLGYLGQQHLLPELSASHRVATGKRQALVLLDGSALTLNTGTAADIRQSSSGHRIRLYQGELMLDNSQASESRIDYSDGSLLATDARYSIRRLSGERCRVCVYRGQVQWSRPGLPPSQLSAGQQYELDLSGAQASPLPYASDAWLRGLLVSPGMPLVAFIRELDRYRPGILRCADEVADLAISGTFNLDHPQQVLATLAQVLPVQVRYRSRYWATVIAA